MIKEAIDTLATKYAIPIALALAALLVFVALQSPRAAETADADMIAPPEGVELPVVWGDMGARLVEVGVIDREKWMELYLPAEASAQAGGTLTDEQKQLLYENNRERLRITRENAGYLLNLFWALGLANRNSILEGEMQNPEYGGAGGFASTGGWTLSKGEATEHYGKYALVPLTPGQQALVKKIADGIYRPCCDNPTSFPDCNHGMAMLGLLELLASQGASEEEMWDAALAANSYWFPDTYQTIALYKEQQGVAWGDVDPEEVLGYDYSSYSGFSRVAAEVAPQSGSGASCSV